MTTRAPADGAPGPTPAPRLFVTVGEPAGIGPDLCLDIATRPLAAALAVAGDAALLRRRADDLGLRIEIEEHDPRAPPPPHRPGRLAVLHTPLPVAVEPGQPDPANGAIVLDWLRSGAHACLEARYDALVTAPLHKGVINDGGVAFSGHTEFLAELAGADMPVMLLCAGSLRVALATTHLPLRAVSEAITGERLHRVLGVLNRDLRQRFALARPRIVVCGLNPHAGESGYLGREEIEVIAPALAALREQGLDLDGPVPADTAFLPSRLAHADAVLAMYHDQGLPVLKHAGFGRAVNVTLGLPFIRTSVDHGTAFDLAGTGRADSGSLTAALELAAQLARHAARR